MNDHARSIAAFVVLTMAMMTWARPAHAEGFLTPFVGFNFGGDSANCISLSNCDEKRLNWGVSFGSRHGIFGFEEDIGYAPSFFGKTEGGDNAVLTVMSNLMVVVPAGPIQPYALAGLGLVRPRAKFDSSSLSSSQPVDFWRAGLGLALRF